MLRTFRIPVVVVATLGLLCGISFAQDRDGDDADEIGDYPSLCSAIEPAAGHSRNYFQVVQYDTLWRVKDGLQGSTEDNIKVGVYFIDGTPEQRRHVEEYAEEWIYRTGIPIEWVFGSQERKHIRITFSGSRNWSWYGNQTFEGDGVQPTMRLGVYNTSKSAATQRRTTLHEFGHALGLMHEQLDPRANLHFNEQVMFPSLQKNWCDQHWTTEKCYAEMIKQIIHPTTPGHECVGKSRYDQKSIMHYWFDKGWVVEYPKGIPLNMKLSGGDVACVRQLYGSNDDETPHFPEPGPYPRPPTQTCSPSGPCCCCCQGSGQSCRIPWPQMPPAWVRHFWDHDEW
jgi:hypothetical protein